MIRMTCLVALLPLAPAQAGPPEKPFSRRVVEYDIHVTLDDADKRLEGRVNLTWHNPSGDAVAELPFHLYTNAFANAKSTFIRELLRSRAQADKNGKPGKIPWQEDDGWGWLRITHITVDGRDVTDRLAPDHPDGDTPDDRSVARVTLPEPIAAHATADIRLTFEAKIPQCKRRTGWYGNDFYLFAHWFPKIGVYETPGMRFVPADAPHGRWNCHTFHAATEFYADYGVFNVTITLPDKYVVGTSGQIVEQRPNGDGTQTVVARAEDVHEFAWVADAQFREAQRVWRSTQTGQEIAIRLLYQPDHESLVDKYLDSVSATLDHVDGWLGPYAYPYPNVTVVDPRKGSSAGGMEYPNMITGGARWWREKVFGDGLRPVESVTIHEFMHQIWYGIVGSNEFEEAWLDEGFTTYSQNRIMTDLWGRDSAWLDWWDITGGVIARRRARYAADPGRNDGSIADPTFAHWDTGVARNFAYSKTSLMLHTLENHLGRDRFDRIMRTYFERWRFRHPCRNDFIAVANEVAGENLNWFFDQLVSGRSTLDYAVASIANVPESLLNKGLFDDDADPPGEDESAEPEQDATASYDSTVVFRRVGEVVFPMDLLVEFADGHIEWETWDGRGRVKVLRFHRPAKIVRAAIDPNELVPLDVDRFNNSRRIEPNDVVTTKYTLKTFFWMQSLLQLFATPG